MRLEGQQEKGDAAERTRRSNAELVSAAAKLGQRQRGLVGKVADSAVLAKKIEDLDNATPLGAALFRQKTFKAPDADGARANSDGGRPGSRLNEDSEQQEREKQRSALLALTYEEKTSEDYVEALADRYPHLSRAEMLLAGVRDWVDFNAKLRMERYAFPTEFIFKEIDVESWKNIPIPLMEATECLERGLVNVSNVLGEIIHEQKARSNFVAARMADIATEADDAHERTRRALEQTRRALAELVEQFKTKAANALEQQRLQLALVHQEVQNDREYL